MGSKTLRKGKRTGLTKNQRRKLDYAALAAAAQRKGGGGSQKPTASRTFTARLPKKNHKRGHLQKAKDARKAEADARQTAYNILTIPQKIEKLDKKLGSGFGAIKQRMKLQLALHKPKEVSRQEQKTENFQHMYGGKEQRIGNTVQQKKEAHDHKVREHRNGRR